MRSIKRWRIFVLITAIVICFYQLHCEQTGSDLIAKATDNGDFAYTNGMAWPSMTGTNEIVMTNGMRFRAIAGDQSIEIKAGEKYERAYTWDGESRSVTMLPREERWYGSLGLYYPGPGNHWKSNHGVTRGVLEEGVLWFDNETSAMRHIDQINTYSDHCLYTHDGLLIAWRKVMPRQQINVWVWQFMINGKKPTNLPGSHDEAVVRFMP